MLSVCGTKISFDDPERISEGEDPERAVKEIRGISRVCEEKKGDVRWRPRSQGNGLGVRGRVYLFIQIGDLLCRRDLPGKRGGRFMT